MGDHFEFTYSASQQEEVRSIRKKYLPQEQDKLEQLRRLDAGVTSKGTMAALILGVFSSLIMGTGMSCCLVWGDGLFVPGIIIGLVGMAGVAMAYPLYVHITEKERKRLAPEILRLTDELMQ